MVCLVHTAVVYTGKHVCRYLYIAECFPSPLRKAHGSWLRFRATMKAFPSLRTERHTPSTKHHIIILCRAQGVVRTSRYSLQEIILSRYLFFLKSGRPFFSPPLLRSTSYHIHPPTRCLSMHTPTWIIQRKPSAKRSARESVVQTHSEASQHLPPEVRKSPVHDPIRFHRNTPHP